MRIFKKGLSLREQGTPRFPVRAGENVLARSCVYWDPSGNIFEARQHPWEQGTPYHQKKVFSKLGKQQEQFLAVTGENVLGKFKV